MCIIQGDDFEVSGFCPLAALMEVQLVVGSVVVVVVVAMVVLVVVVVVGIRMANRDPFLWSVGVLVEVVW